MTKEKSGFIFALSDMVTYGLLPVFSHYFSVLINPLLFGGLSMIVGAIPLLLILRANGTLNELYVGKHMPKLGGFVLLTSLGSVFYFLGTKYTSGINTGLLTQIEPFYALILGVLVLREKVTLKQVMSLTIMVIGALLLSYRGLNGINVGDLLILSAPLLFQMSHLTAKTITTATNEPNLIPTARLLYGGIILASMSILMDHSVLTQINSLGVIISIIVFGLIFRTLDLWLWYQAIHRISPAKASALIPLAGLISFVGSLIILHERPTLQHYIGLALILGGLTWYSVLQYSHYKAEALAT